MNTVRLGKTELLVLQVGFGGIPIIPLGFEDGVAVVRHCFERGMTFFDTANMYGDSEKKIGQALETVRDKVVIATKTLERSAEGAAKHIAFSLENLKTDYIDSSFRPDQVKILSGKCKFFHIALLAFYAIGKL